MSDLFCVAKFKLKTWCETTPFMDIALSYTHARARAHTHYCLWWTCVCRL